MVKLNTCGVLIKQISDELEKRANNGLRKSDLTMTQMNALLILRNNNEKPMPLKDLERALHVAQSTAAGIINRLEQKKFVESFGSFEDKRIKMVKISNLGIKYCQTADERVELIEKEILSSLDDVEKQTLLELLKKVRDSLQ